MTKFNVGNGGGVDVRLRHMDGRGNRASTRTWTRSRSVALSIAIWVCVAFCLFSSLPTTAATRVRTPLNSSSGTATTATVPTDNTRKRHGVRASSSHGQYAIPVDRPTPPLPKPLTDGVLSYLEELRLNKKESDRGSAFDTTRIGSFWQFTDVHMDYLYAVQDSDEMNYCHRTTNVSAPKSGTFGDYHCDSPISLVLSATKFMADTEPNPDFILWTGDSVPHTWGLVYPHELVLENLANLTQWIIDAFPHTPVFPVLGNHDVSPLHQIAPGPNWLLNNVTEMWTTPERWIAKENTDTFLKGGFYSQLVHKGLRILGLNTIFYYSQDNQVTNFTDPAGQLKWLSKQLLRARDNGERVFIVAHVPPGADERIAALNFHTNFNQPYLDVLGPFSDVIVAHIYGHEHSDTFRVWTPANSSSSSPSSPLSPPPIPFDPQTQIALLAPSLTPWYNNWTTGFDREQISPNNPGLRLYLYDRESSIIVDYIQYYVDLDTANRVGKLEWEIEYVFSSSYQTNMTKGITAASMTEVYNSLSANQTLFQQYFHRNSVDFNANSSFSYPPPSSPTTSLSSSTTSTSPIGSSPSSRASPPAPSSWPYVPSMCDANCTNTQLCVIRYLEEDLLLSCLNRVG